MAKAYEEYFRGYAEDPEAILSKTFEETEGYDEMIVLRGIRFESHCEHHMAPIIGRAWIAYIPKGRVVGISKLARIVEVYAKRLQIQEKMTAQIANAIDTVLQPQGVGVVLEGRALLHDGARHHEAGHRPRDEPHARRVPRQPGDAPGIPVDHRVGSAAYCSSAQIVVGSRRVSRGRDRRALPARRSRRARGTARTPPPPGPQAVRSRASRAAARSRGRHLPSPTSFKLPTIERT